MTDLADGRADGAAAAVLFPEATGKPRVDDQRVLSGIVSSTAARCAGGMRRAPNGSRKTLYNRWKRWGGAGVFTRMMEGLAAATGVGPKTVMIDANSRQSIYPPLLNGAVTN